MPPTMKRLAGWGVATIRVLKDGEPAVAECAGTALGADWPASHGAWTGNDPWLIWRSPVERIALSSAPERLKTLLDVLNPGGNAAGCAVDLSESIAVWHLEGAALPQMLARHADATALPPPGCATRLRWADVAAILMRRADGSALLLADATLDPYLAEWWAFACDAL